MDNKKRSNNNKGRGRGRRRGNRNKTVSEYDQKVLDIARVARMVAGGRRFNFRATVVVGNRKGKVGIGVGKGRDVALAINKAVSAAEKNVIKVPMTPEGTIPYEIKGKQTGSVVYLKPARQGRGIIAGGAVRVICDLAGYSDITAKLLSRSTNKLNNALATVNALEKVNYAPEVAAKQEAKNSKNSKNKKSTKKAKATSSKKTKTKTSKKKKVAKKATKEK
ncbi:MAG: 30S ribosomal protein S5 [Candidatus Spechtbacterales bacterium]|nr:30S ribosomal protein S5 [Candidatus Spechtbacterales bacterium]